MIHDLKAANRRRDDESQRVRDDVQNLKDAIPRALDNQKDLTDTRLREVNAELKSLKTLITQRMNPAATSASVGNYLRPAVSGSATPGSPPTPAPVEPATAAAVETKQEQEPKPAPPAAAARSSPFSSGMQSRASIPAWQMAAKNAAPAAPAAAANGTDAESGSEAQEGSTSA